MFGYDAASHDLRDTSCPVMICHLDRSRLGQGLEVWGLLFSKLLIRYIITGIDHAVHIPCVI